ncbi:MAG: thioredoxin [Haloarculaceae archaeon]
MSMDESNDELEELREKRRRELLGDDEASGTLDEPVYVDGQAELDAVVGDHDVVLVDFYADWCGPCKMLEPIVADLAAETDAVVAKVDVDANQQLAAQFGVRGVPTVVLFAGGEAVDEMVGVRDKSFYADRIEEAAA